MSWFSSSRRLPTVATFVLEKGILLKVARGSVVDFGISSSSPNEEDDTHEKPHTEDDNDGHNNKKQLKKRLGAIVNAANEGCLGGGGVDGAISNAGGENLYQDRLALPILKDDQHGGSDDSSNDDRNAEEEEAFMGRAIRCRTGSAVITGPGDYGPGLKVPFVIHAVGPMYFQYEDFEVPDRLLGEAYVRSLDLCQENGISDVAFSLLSAGVFRGARELRTVLQIGIESISMWCAQEDNGESLQSITLCGFNAREAKLLENVSKEVVGEPLDEKTVKGDHPTTNQEQQQEKTEENDELAMNASEDQKQETLGKDEPAISDSEDPQQEKAEEQDEVAMIASKQHQETMEEHEPVMNDNEEFAVETAGKEETVLNNSYEPDAEMMEELKPATNESEEPAPDTMEEDEPTANDSAEPAPETMEEEKPASDTVKEHEPAKNASVEPSLEPVEDLEPVTTGGEHPAEDVDPGTKENGKPDVMEGDTSDGDEKDGGAKRKRSLRSSDGNVPAIADTSPTDEGGSVALPEHKKVELDTEDLS